MVDGDWLIDERGSVFQSRSHAFYRSLNISGYDGNIENDVIRNLGFVRIRKRGDRSILSLRLRAVSDVALASAFYFLLDYAKGLVVLDSLGKDQPTEILQSTRAAIDRINFLRRNLRHASNKFQETILPLSAFNVNDPLHELLLIWRAGCHSDIDSLIQFSASRLANRYLVTEADGGVDLRFVKLGKGLKVPDPTWRFRALGALVETQPDAEFWNWAALKQRAALKSREAMLADISTDIYWPGSGWVHRAYRRILLPCTTEQGRYLFSANDDTTVGQRDLKAA